MAICLDCEKTKLIPTCTDDLILGKISDFNEDVDIYVRNVTLDQLHIFEVDENDVQIVSDGTGLVTLPMQTKNIWNASHYYEVWIIKESATDIEDRETITIGLITTACLNLRFSFVENQDSESEVYTTQTVAL